MAALLLQNIVGHTSGIWPYYSYYKIEKMISSGWMIDRGYENIMFGYGGFPSLVCPVKWRGSYLWIRAWKVCIVDYHSIFSADFGSISKAFYESWIKRISITDGFYVGVIYHQSQSTIRKALACVLFSSGERANGHMQCRFASLS